MLESEEARNLFSDLEKDLTTLQNINFRQGDDFDKVWIIKDFLEKNKPTTRSLINLGFEVLNGWALDETKVNLYKDELIKLLNSIHLRNLLVAVPFRSIHDTDAITAIKDEKADLEKQLKDALELAKTREEEIEKLKGDNMHITHERDNMKVDLEQMKLKLVETDTHYTQRIEELMKKIPAPTTPATPRGSRK